VRRHSAQYATFRGAHIKTVLQTVNFNTFTRTTGPGVHSCWSRSCPPCRIVRQAIHRNIFGSVSSKLLNLLENWKACWPISSLYLPHISHAVLITRHQQKTQNRACVLFYAGAAGSLCCTPPTKVGVGPAFGKSPAHKAPSVCS
jgi:hypothetical protein